MRGFRIAPLFAVLALAGSLGGCITLGDISTGLSTALGYTVTQNQVDAARASYDAAVLAPAARYRANPDGSPRPMCKTGQSFAKDGCAKRSVVLALQAADKDVAAAFDTLQQKLDAGDQPGVVAAYSALQAAVKAAENIVKSFGLD